jgi:hypothetical protein
MSSSKKISTKNKKSKLPASLIILGLLELVLPLAIIWMIVPASLDIASHIGNKAITVGSYMPLGAILALFIGQIFFGIRLQQSQNKSGMLNYGQRKQAIIVFSLSIIVFIIALPLTLIFAVSPIYSLLSEIR